MMRNVNSGSGQSRFAGFTRRILGSTQQKKKGEKT